MDKLKDKSKDASQNSVQIDKGKYRDMKDEMERSSGPQGRAMKRENRQNQRKAVIVQRDAKNNNLSVKESTKSPAE